MMSPPYVTTAGLAWLAKVGDSEILIDLKTLRYAHQTSIWSDDARLRVSVEVLAIRIPLELDGHARIQANASSFFRAGEYLSGALRFFTYVIASFRESLH